MMDKNKIQIKSIGSFGEKKLIIKNWFSEIFNKNFSMEYHEHPQIELMYCAKGYFEFEYYVNENLKQWESVLVPANSFILVNTGFYHKITINKDDTKILNIEFEAVEIHPFLDNENKLRNNFLFSIKEI